MFQKSPPPLHARRLRGFSLVELLAVIGIISILMTVAAIGVGNVLGGKGVTSAVAISESIFNEARSTAVSKRTKSRVLLDITDPKDRENYLRRMLVIFEDLDEDGNVKENDWVIAGRATLLPDQTFFSREFSSKSQNGGSELDQMTLSNVNRSFQGTYLYYEFNGEGVSANPGASFVVGTGARELGAQKPRVTASTKNDFGGLIVWRNGRTSIYRSPEQIGIPDKVQYF